MAMKFKATYLRRVKNNEVLRVNLHTPTIRKVLEKVCNQVERKRMNGKPVWKGITNDNGLYQLWVNKNPMLIREGKIYWCEVTRIDVRVSNHPTSKYCAFVNMTISATSERATRRIRTHGHQTSLQEHISRIYAPIKSLEFPATYEGQKEIKLTGCWRELWTVRPSSTAMTKALEQINREIDGASFNGQRMSNIVWRGITGSNRGFQLWVNPTKQESVLESYKQGYLYNCNITFIEVFRNRLIKKYKAGVNIYMEAEEMEDSNSDHSDSELDKVDDYHGYVNECNSDDDDSDDDVYDLDISDDSTYDESCEDDSSDDYDPDGSEDDTDSLEEDNNDSEEDDTDDQDDYNDDNDDDDSDEDEDNSCDEDIGDGTDKITHDGRNFSDSSGDDEDLMTILRKRRRRRSQQGSRHMETVEKLTGNGDEGFDVKDGDENSGNDSEFNDIDEDLMTILKRRRSQRGST